MDEQKTYTINKHEYLLAPCLRQIDLASAIINQSGIEVDFEKDNETTIQQKVAKFAGYLVKSQKTLEFLFFILKRKDEPWSADKLDEYSKDFETEGTFSFTLIVGTFFLMYMQMSQGYLGTLQPSTEEKAP